MFGQMPMDLFALSIYLPTLNKHTKETHFVILQQMCVNFPEGMIYWLKYLSAGLRLLRVAFLRVSLTDCEMESVFAPAREEAASHLISALSFRFSPLSGARARAKAPAASVPIQR